MKLINWKFTRPRLRITYKILLYYLALLLISLILTGYLAQRGLIEVGRIVAENNAYLSKNISTNSISALESESKTLILNKALETAKQAKMFLELYPDLDIHDIKLDAGLGKIVAQSFGSTGYTSLYLEKQPSIIDSFEILFDINPSLNNVMIKDFGETQFAWDSLVLSNRNLVGYYKWKNTDGFTTLRFITFVTLDGTGYMDSVSGKVNLIHGVNGRLFIAASIDTDELLASARSIQPEIRWASLQTQSEIERQRNQMQMTYTGIIAMIIAVSCGLAFFFAKTITKPILSLKDSAKIIAQGDFTHRVDIHTGDELDDLAGQFNEMAVALDDSYRNLEAKVAERTRIEKRRSEQLRTINEVSRKISSILSIDKLLPYIVESLSESFHYFSVQIYTMDPKTGKINNQASSGQGAKIMSLDSGENAKNYLILRAFHMCQPLIVPDISQEKNYRPESVEVKSAVAIPVMMGKTILGVIEVQSVELNAFDDVDLFTLQTLADQIAVAITNVHLYKETRDFAVVEERNRLAREIHDTFTQGFAGIVLQLEAAEQSLGEDIKQAQIHLDRARALARENLYEARHSVWTLHPATAETSDILDDLRNLITGFIQKTGVHVSFKVSEGQRPLHPDTKEAILRITRESLTNVEKHAKAQKVDIHLVYKKDSLELTILDNGVGFNPDSNNRDGFGLVSMKERSQSLGGTLTVQSKKGKGTSIAVTIPTKREQANG